MPESSATLLRAGGYAAFSIIPLLIASGIAFWLFLNGAGAIFGPINDLLVVISLALLALPVLAIRSIAAQHVGPWFDVITRARARRHRSRLRSASCCSCSGSSRSRRSFVHRTASASCRSWRGCVAVGIIAGRIDALPDQLGWVTLALFAMIVVVAIGSGSPARTGRRRRVGRRSSPRWPAGWSSVGWTCLDWPLTAPAASRSRASGPPRRPRAGPRRGRARRGPCRPAGHRSSRPSASGHRPRPGRPAWARRRCGGR